MDLVTWQVRKDSLLELCVLCVCNSVANPLEDSFILSQGRGWFAKSTQLHKKNKIS